MGLYGRPRSSSPLKDVDPIDIVNRLPHADIVPQAVDISRGGAVLRVIAPPSIMSFNDQDRSGGVTLSAAKGLARWAQRCFAALSMTFPVLVVKVHNRASTP